MADVFKFTEDQRAALKLIGGTVRNLLLFGDSLPGKTLILLFSCWSGGARNINSSEFYKFFSSGSASYCSRYSSSENTETHVCPRCNYI